MPRTMPSIPLTRQVIASALASIITNAKADFAPFEDSGSSSGSASIGQNNYVALEERGKNEQQKSRCWILVSCDRHLRVATVHCGAVFIAV